MLSYDSYEVEFTIIIYHAASFHPSHELSINAIIYQLDVGH